MKEASKPNDIFVTALTAPLATTLELLQNNINSENTSFLSKEEYKKSPMILKAFTKDDIFDEDTFNKVYDFAEQRYFELDDADLYLKLASGLEYSERSRYRPIDGKIRTTEYKPEVIKNNPLGNSYSITGFNKQDESAISAKEAAQKGKIWDPKNKQWLNETAESRSLASKLFGDTLVYAQYQQDGIQKNPVTGEYGRHSKGEFITDADGNYFTLLLGKDELLGQEVVSAFDILTEEGSLANKFDFLDSDGKNKSVAGVAAKTIAAVLPYMIPGFNTYYGAFTATVGLMSVMPTFYKSMDSLFTNGNSNLSKEATYLENWFRKFDPGMSDTGKESFFSIESIGNLLADTFGQLYQQRAAAKLSEAFYKMPKEFKTFEEYLKYKPEMEKMAKLGKAFSLGYMGLQSGAEVYNDALKAGYDPRTAGVASLASTAALFGIMNFNESANGLGTWFLNSSTGFSHEVARRPVTRIAKENLRHFDNAIKETIKSGSTAPLAESLINYKIKIADWLDDAIRVGAEGIWKNMVVEGIEEISEEAILDSVKGVIDTLSWLGFTGKQGSFGGWDNVFSREGLQRYLETFVGGALGGGLFALLNNTIEPYLIRKFKDPNYKSQNLIENDIDIIDLILSGRTDELIDEIKHAGKIISNKRAATGFVDANGKLHDIKAEGQTTQSDMVVKATIEHILELDSFVKHIVKSISPEAFLSGALDEDFRKGWGSIIRNNSKFEEFKAYALGKFEESLEKTKDAFEAYNSSLAPNKEEESKKTVDSKTISESDKRIKHGEQIKATSRLEKDFLTNLDYTRGFFSGQQQIDSYKEGLLLENERLISSLLGMDERTYYETVYRGNGYDIDYDKLPKEKSKDPFVLTLPKLKEEYEIFSKTKNRDVKSLLKLLPKLRIVQDRLQALISNDLSKFASMEHKEAVIKSLEKSTFSNELLESLIDEIDPTIFFSDAEDLDVQLELIDAENKKSILKRGIKGQLSESDSAVLQEDKKLAAILKDFRSRNIVLLLRSHPKAITLNQRLSFDYASKLVGPVFKISDKFNDALKKIINIMINKEIVASRLSQLNQLTAEAIINNVNNQIINDSIFKSRLESLADSDEEQANGIGLKGGFVTLASDTIDPTLLKDFQIKDLLDYIGEDQFISKELFESVIQYHKINLLLGFDSIKENFVQHDVTQTDFNFDDIITKLENGDFEAFKTLFNEFRQNLDSSVEISSSYESPDLLNGLYKIILDLNINDLNLEFADGQLLLTTDNFNKLREGINAYFKEVGDKILELSTKYKDTIIENPLINAAHKVYYALTDGETSGDALIKWAYAKAKKLRDNNLDGDEELLTADDLQHVDLAIKTLLIILNVATGMINYNSTTDYRLGYNQALYDYLLAWGKSTEDLDKIGLIEKDTYTYFQSTIGEMIDKLSTLKIIDQQLTSDKLKLYDELEKSKLNALCLFYANHEPKIKLSNHTYSLKRDEYPEVDPNKIGLNIDIEYAKDYVSKCEQYIHLAFKQFKESTLYKDFKNEDENDGLTDDELMAKIIHDTYYTEDFNSLYYNTAASISEAILCTDTANNIHRLFIMDRLLGLSKTSIEKVLLITKEVFAENENIFPRIDQQIAVEQLIFFLEDIKGHNALLKLICDDYNKLATAADESRRTYFRTLLKNCAIVLGEGGSGKTLIVSILAKYKNLESELGFKEVIAAAKQKDKAESLKSLIGIKTGHTLETITNKGQLEANSKAFVLFRSKCLSEIAKYVTEVIKNKRTYTLDKDIASETEDSLVFKNNLFTFSISKKQLELSDGISSNLQFKFDESSFKDLELICEKNSLIVLDEYTLLNLYEINALAYLAEKNNCTIIFLGDESQLADQASYTITNLQTKQQSTIYQEFSAENWQATYTNKLIGSWRADNTATRDNSTGMKRLVEHMGKLNENSGQAILDCVASIYNEKDNEKVKEHNEDFNWKYKYLVNDPIKFIGTFVGRGVDIEEPLKAIHESQPSKQTSETKKICVIVNPNTSEDDKKKIAEELISKGLSADEFKIQEIVDVQGAEYDFTIAYKLTSSGNSLSGDMHRIYTEVTRSRFGNLVIQADNNDLFDGANLNRSQISNAARRLKESSYSKLNKVFVERLDRIIRNLPNAITKKEEANEDDSKEMVSIQDANKEEAKLRLSPVKQIDIPEDAPDKEDKQSKTTDKISEAAEKSNTVSDWSICQGWYMHPGVSAKTIAKLRNITKAGPIEDLESVFEETEKDSELYYFYQYLKLAERTPNFSSEEFKSKYSISIKIISGEDFVRAFKIFINDLATQFHDNDLDFYINVLDTYDESIDSPLDKINDAGKKSRQTITRICLNVPFEGDNHYFTIGTNGWMFKTDKPDGNPSSETILNVFKNKKGEYILFTAKDKEENEFFKAYHEGKTERGNRAKPKTTGFVTLVTGYRSVKMDDDDERLNTFSGFFPENFDLNLGHRRFGLRTAWLLAYAITNIPVEATDSDTFLLWFNSFRVEDIKNVEALETIKRQFKGLWFVMKLEGTNDLIPVRITHIILSIRDYILKDAETKTYIFTDKGLLNSYMHNKLISGLCRVQNVAKSVIDNIFKGNSISYDQKTGIFLGLDEVLQGISDLLTTFTNTDELLLAQKLLDSYVNLMKRYALLDAFRVGDEVNFKALRANTDQKYLYLIDKENHGVLTSDTIKKIEKLLIYLDTLLPNYFYEVDPTLDVAKVQRLMTGQDPGGNEYVMEYGYERSNLLIDYSKVQEVKSTSKLEVEFGEPTETKGTEDSLNSMPKGGQTTGEEIKRVLKENEVITLLKNLERDADKTDALKNWLLDLLEKKNIIELFSETNESIDTIMSNNANNSELFSQLNGEIDGYGYKELDIIFSHVEKHKSSLSLEDKLVLEGFKERMNKHTEDGTFDHFQCDKLLNKIDAILTEIC